MRVDARLPFSKFRCEAVGHRYFIVALRIGMLLSPLAGCVDPPEGSLPTTAGAMQSSPSQPPPTSLFGKTAITARAVVVDREQNPIPLESLIVHASPASVVQPAITQAIAESNARVAEMQSDLSAAELQRRNIQARLDETREKNAAEYNKQLEDLPDLAAKNARNPLGALTAWKTAKNKIDIAFRKTHEETVVPIENDLSTTNANIQSINSQIFSERARQADMPFTALPPEGQQTWTTGENGEFTAALSLAEPWVIWCETTRDIKGIGREHYRWVLKVPDALDASGNLFIDHNNLFDGSGLVRSGGSQTATNPRRSNSN